MKRDDIIKMAEDAGFIWETDHPAIVALAELAYAAGAAAERKRIISANAPEIERINEYIKTMDEAELRLQMDLRDYFAAKAMQALLTSIESGKEHQAALVPSTAYDIADAMLKEREK